MRSVMVAGLWIAILACSAGCEDATDRPVGIVDEAQLVDDEPARSGRDGDRDEQEEEVADSCPWASPPPDRRATTAAPAEQWAHETIASPDEGYGAGPCDGDVVDFETEPDGAYRLTVAHDPGLFTEAECEAYSLRLAVWMQTEDEGWSLVDVSANRGGLWFVDGCYFTKTIGDVTGTAAIRAHASAWHDSDATGQRSNTALALMIERTN